MSERTEKNLDRRDFADIRIESERVTLIPITEGHAEIIQGEFTAEITELMHPSPLETIDETREWIRNSLKEMEAGTNIQMVIVDKESEEFLGCAGLHDLDGRIPELGVWVKKSSHGNSFGEESMRALKEWAQSNLDFDYILYPVDENNIPSKKIAEKLGGRMAREYDEEDGSGRVHHWLEYRIYPDK